MYLTSSPLTAKEEDAIYVPVLHSNCLFLFPLCVRISLHAVQSCWRGHGGSSASSGRPSGRRRASLRRGNSKKRLQTLHSEISDGLTRARVSKLSRCENVGPRHSQSVKCEQMCQNETSSLNLFPPAHLPFLNV